MSPAKFQQITARYSRLSVALLGDFCLDRYLEIDPARAENSIETNLEVFNVVAVRSQPGGAGTVLNNLAALGVRELLPLGFAGEDGEGFELLRSLRARPGVAMDGFLQTPLRRTFTYCKPLLIEPGKPPRELNRLDSKNWTPTPPQVEQQLISALRACAQRVDALIIMDQVDLAGTGVLTPRVLDAVAEIARQFPRLWILADCRRGLRGYPPVCWKMNRVELGKLLDSPPPQSLEHTAQAATRLARANARPVFVTLAEDGLLAATPDGLWTHSPSLPVRGEIDIVGAGDAVTANLAAALAAGASPLAAMELANAAASVVIHQLGTTGTASVPQIAELLTGPA